MRRRYWTFRGGIDLADEKHATIDSAIEPCPLPSRLLVPLVELDGLTVEPVVRPGQVVRAGETIARGESMDDELPPPDIAAPLGGRIAAFTTASIAQKDEFVQVPAIEITDLQAPSADSAAPAQPEFDWRSASPEQLRQRLHGGRLTTYSRPLASLCILIQRAREAKCRTLVANAMECQPYVTADHRVLAENGEDVVAGLAILAAAMEARDTILAVDHRRTGDYRGLERQGRAQNVDAIALLHKYPTGVDAMLAMILGGKEIPLGGTAFDLGMVVVHAATCLAAYQWVVKGVRPTGRVVTVSGQRTGRHGNFWVPFGASIHELSGGVNWPLVHGGPMVGLATTADAVVTPGTDAVLALDDSDSAAPGPCIRCSWCTDHCPARLNVAMLNDMYELGQVERAHRGGVQACVECGVCSYICPARLPLAQRVRQLKKAAGNLQPGADAGKPSKARA